MEFIGYQFGKYAGFVGINDIAAFFIKMLTIEKICSNITVLLNNAVM